jgi:sterol desaturase/sphingolipid hydroxylase (fatty acid hydroxylase superfamily)
MRGAAHGLALVSLGLAAVGLVRDRSRLALLGAALALGAWGIAGADPIAAARADQGWLALDWLAADMLVVGLVIVPLERLFPQRQTPLARAGWGTDARYFLINHLGVHGIGLLGALVATHALGWVRLGLLTTQLGAWPLPLQVLVLLVVTDLVQYALHRAMHEIPWLWRIHAIHHSSHTLDALAGSRIPVVETLLTRVSIYATVFALGLPFEAFLIYAAFIALQGSFIHANVRFAYGWLEHVIVSPRFHHWHHASDPEAIDTNYAGTFPWIDRLFGTHHLPRAERWPERYGVVKEVIPPTVLAQQRFPFRARPAARFTAVRGDRVGVD